MSNFKVGDLVVCIDAVQSYEPHRARSLPYYNVWVATGRVYTVRAVDPVVRPGRITGIYLNGMHNKYCPDMGCEVGYNSNRFKKFEYRSISTSKKTVTIKQHDLSLC